MKSCDSENSEAYQLRRTWVKVAGALAIVTLLCAAVWGVAYESKEVVEGVSNLIHGKTEVETQCFLERSDPIFEMAAVSEDINVQTGDKDTFWLSEKKLRCSGRFRVKYGVAGESGIEYYRKGTNIVRLGECPITVLSCELIPHSLDLETENGWWNKVTDEDRVHVQNLLLKAAREQAEKRWLAKDVARRRLTELLQKRLENELPVIKG